MPREIKFRAWDKEKKELFSLGNPLLPKYRNSLKEYGEYELMQYTGLKDKNGKDIYDGDLLKYVNSKGVSFANSLHQVIYQESRGRFALKVLDDKINEPRSLVQRSASWDNSRFQIIGNIYENPELLKE